MEKTQTTRTSQNTLASAGEDSLAGLADGERPFPFLGSYSRQDCMKKAAYYLLETQEASQEQLQFFETWLKLVFDEAVHVSPDGGAQLRVPTDLESFELSIKASRELMLRLASRFVEACKVPDLRMMRQLTQLESELQEPEISLWCRIKRMGKPEQSVDAGFHIEHTLQWLVADIVVPKSEDQALLRNNAMSNRLVPHAYGASLFPVEPESSLTFDMETGSLKSSILSALFIFKALGFAKPDDLSLTAITHVDAMKCHLLAFLGPRGLTRLALRFLEPSSSCAMDLTNACSLDKEVVQDHLESLEFELNNEGPSFVEYAAEKRGYTVTVGYVL